LKIFGADARVRDTHGSFYTEVICGIRAICGHLTSLSHCHTVL
jgi:hypothetical protein